jgi:hypothetical protein
LLAAGDEHGGAPVDDAVCHRRLKPAVERQLARTPLEAVDLGDRRGEQLGLVARPDPRAGREERAARA